MKVLNKIQKLPETKRKMILWTLLIIIAFVLLSVWGNNLKQRYQGLNPNLPSFGKELENLPKIEIPKLNEEQ